MKYKTFLVSFFLFVLTISCGVCYPTNLEFKNQNYFTVESLKGIDLNSDYLLTSTYEATRDLKKISEPRRYGNIRIKFLPDGFVRGDLWSSNKYDQQGIIYTKNGLLFIDKIGSTQDRCKFIESYKVKFDGEKIILVEDGRISNARNVMEYSKIN